MSPMDDATIVQNPEWIKGFVAGGSSASMGIASDSTLGGSDFVTRKTTLPAKMQVHRARLRETLGAMQIAKHVRTPDSCSEPGD